MVAKEALQQISRGNNASELNTADNFIAVGFICSNSYLVAFHTLRII